MILQIAHFLAGVIVLAEALNKLERTSPCAPGMSLHDRIVDGLKAAAWALLALGAGGAVVSPIMIALGTHTTSAEMMRIEHPTIAETAVLLGFAVLIIRTRVKEG